MIGLNKVFMSFSDKMFFFVTFTQYMYNFFFFLFPNIFALQGPVFFLEDGKSAISLNDALMWAKVNPFSPLGTGIRLNPF